MVSIVTGNDLGVSTNTSSGKQEGANLSRDRVTVNSATGNLLVQGQDEVLTSLGVDLPIVRTYNSQGIINGNDIDTWALSIHKRLLQIPSNPNSQNSRIVRESGDDAQSEFVYDSIRKLYVSTEGKGAHDTLSYDSNNQIWTWTNGTPGVAEEYNSQGQLETLTDADNNTQSYSYKDVNGVSVMRKIKFSNGQEVRFNYADNPLSNGSTPKLEEILTRVKNYVVKEGDTWSSIALSVYGTSSAATDLQNDFNNITLKAGSELIGLGKINGTRPEESRTRYGYDHLDRLVQVIVDLTPEDDAFTLQADPNTGLYKSVNGQTYVTTYSYEGNSQRIAGITQGDGTQMSFGYDPSGRINRITDGLGKNTTLSYDGQLSQTVITQLGSSSAKDIDALSRERHQTSITEADNTVTRYLNDGHGRLRSRITYPQAGQTIAVHYAYDKDDNIIQTTQADGTHKNYQYNDRGNLELQQDSEGNTVSYRYDSLDRQVAKIEYGTPDALPDDSNNTANDAAVTRYVYDGKHHLRFVISPDGQVTENHYLANGNRDFTRQFTHDQYPISGLADSANLSQSQMQNWVSGRNLSRVQRTDYAYDFRGQVNATTTYASVSTNGSGIKDGSHSVTRFVYDVAGRLLQKVDARGTASNTIGDYTTHYIYDGLGRLIQSTNANDEVTSTAYDDVNNQVIDTSAAGLITTSIYDANGQLMQTVQGSQEQWTQDFSNGLTGFNGNVSNKPEYIQLLNGRVVLRTQSTVSGGTWPTLYRQQKYNYSESMVFRSEVTTGATANGRILLIGADNTGRSANTAYRRQAAYFREGNLFSNHYDAAEKKFVNRLLGTSENDTTYIVEVETTALGSTLFVYEKGKNRVDGWQYFNDVADWQVSRGRMWTYGSPNRKVAEMYVDNMSESKSLLSTTQYKYDIDGKLRYTIDPNGIKTHQLYDSADRLVASVDGDGTLSETVYDVKGQVAKNIVYGKNLSTTLLNSLVNTDGSPANVSLTSLRAAATNSDDRAQQNVYDDAGRLRFTVDAENYVTETRYDGRSQVTDTIAYANSLSQAIADFSSVTDVAAQLIADPANDRHQRLYYDADGQLIGNLDAEGYLNEINYDQAGRQYHTLQYAGKVSNYDLGRSDWSFQSLKNDILFAQYNNAVPLNNIHSYTLYNSRGQITGVIDGEGYLSENRYDNVGNVNETIRYAAKARAYSSTATIASVRPTGAQPIDGTGQVIANQRTQFHYNDLNQLHWARDTQNILTTYNYDVNGNVINETRYAAQQNNQNAAANADQRTQTSVYNEKGQLTAKLSGEGSDLLASAADQTQIDLIWKQHSTHYSYDGAGRLRRSLDQWGNISTFYYNEDNQLVYTINGKGEVQKTEYNSFGELSKSILYSRRIGESATGTSALNLMQLLGGQVNSAIINLINKIALASADAVTQQEYTLRGLVKTNIDAENYRSEFEYNAFGEMSDQRVQTKSGGAGNTPLLINGMPNQNISRGDKFEYDRRGLLTDTYQDAGTRYFNLNIHKSSVYDAFGRAIHVRDGNGNNQENIFDNIGRVIQIIDPSFQRRTTVYDAHSRVLTETDALQSNNTQYHYDEAERSVTIITPEGISSKTIQNEHGETLQIEDGNGVITQYIYDKNGNVETITEAVGTEQQRVTTNLYENSVKGEFNRLYETTNGEGQVVRLEYDSANRLLHRIVDPGAGNLNITTRYEYDSAGRSILTKEAYGTSEERSVQQIYDKKGQLFVRMVDPSNGGVKLSTRYQFDALGNVVRTDQMDNSLVHKTVTYGYDALGRRESETVSMSGSGNNITSRYHYDDNNNVVVSIDGNSNKTRYVYNERNELVYTINALGEVSKNLYDANGRVTDNILYHQRITIPVSTMGVTNAYVDGLIQTNLNDTNFLGVKFRQEHYIYNGDGQRVSTTVSEGQYKATPSASDGKHIVSEYAYDRSGNLIYEVIRANSNDPEQSATDREQYHVYDALNREVLTINTLGHVSETHYDAVNNVIEVVRHAVPADITTVKSILSNTVLNAQQRIDAINISINSAYTLKAVDKQTNQQSTHYLHDDANRLIYTVDAEGSVTKNIYATTGDLVTQIRYSQQITRADTFGATPTFAVMENLTTNFSSTQNQSTHYVHDKAGRQTYIIQVFKDIRVANMQAYVTKTSYSATDKVGETTQYYDAIDASSFVSGIVLTETNIQDLLNARTNTSSEKDLITQYIYDGNHRLENKITAVGTSEQYQEDYYYDKNGNLIAQTNGNGDTHYYRYNAANHQDRSLNAEGYMVDYEYDVYGNVSEQTTYMNKLTNMPNTINTDFIDFNELNATAATQAGFSSNINVKDGDRHESFRFDVFGQQVRHYSPTINTAKNGYQRVETNYQYDNFGNLIRTIQAVGLAEERAIDRRYDALNQVTKEYKGRKLSQAINDALYTVAFTEYQYDTFGNQVTIIDPRAEEAIRGISDWAKEFRDLTGLTDAESIRDQFTTRQIFDLANRKTAAILTDSSFTNFSQDTGRIDTEYDAFGNIIVETDARGNSKHYVYDNLNRVSLMQDRENAVVELQRDVHGSVIHEIKFRDKVLTRIDQNTVLNFADNHESLEKSVVANDLSVYSYSYPPLNDMYGMYMYPGGYYDNYSDSYMSLNFGKAKALFSDNNLISVDVVGSFDVNVFTKLPGLPYPYTSFDQTIESVTINEHIDISVSPNTQSYSWYSFGNYYYDPEIRQAIDGSMNAVVTFNYMERGVLKSYNFNISGYGETGLTTEIQTFKEVIKDGSLYQRIGIGGVNLKESDGVTSPEDVSRIEVAIAYTTDTGETKTYTDQFRYSEILEGLKIDIPLLTNSYIVSIDNIKYTSVTENAQVISGEFNVLSQNVSTTDALGNTEYFAYDALGNTTQYMDKNGYGIQYKYDSVGNKIEEHLPFHENDISKGNWKNKIDVAPRTDLENTSVLGSEMISLPNGQLFYVRGAVVWEYDSLTNEAKNPIAVGIQPKSQGHAVTSDGKAMLTHVGTNNRVEYATYDPKIGWQTARLFTPVSNVSFVTLVSLPDDIPLMMIYADNIIHAYTYDWGNQTWTPSDQYEIQPISTGGVSTFQPEIRVGNDGTVFVRFGDIGGSSISVIKYSLFTGFDNNNVYTKYGVSRNQFASLKQLAVDEEGNAYQIFYTKSIFTPFHHIYFQKYDNQLGSWQQAVYLDRSYYQPQLKMTVDPDGSAYVLMQNNNYSVNLYSIVDGKQYTKSQYFPGSVETDIVSDVEGNISILANSNANAGSMFWQLDSLNTQDPYQQWHKLSGGENRFVLASDGNIIVYGDSEIKQFDRRVVNEFAYDAMGNNTQVIASKNVSQRVISYEYDKKDNQLSTIYPAESQFNQLIDKNNALKAFSTPRSPKEVKTYDALGNNITETNRNFFITRNEYDVNDRKVVSKDAAGFLHEFKYDAAGNMFRQKDYVSSYSNANAQIRNYYGFRTFPIYSETRQRQYLYDGRNQLASTGSVDVAPVMVSTGGQYTVSVMKPSTRYLYDGNGNVIEDISAKNSVRTYEFDKNNQKNLEIDQLGYYQTWGFDSYGNNVVQTRYANKIFEVDNPDQNRVTEFSYDAQNQQVESRLRNVKYIGKNFYAGPQTGDVVDQTYYDAVGNVIRTVDAEGNDILKKYDARNKLIEKQHEEHRTDLGEFSRPTTQFKYNSHGDLIQEVRGHYQKEKFTVNQYQSALNPSGSKAIRTLKYNNNGWLIEENDVEGKHYQYRYDSAGNVVHQTEFRTDYNSAANRIHTLYYYDGLNREVLRANPYTDEDIYPETFNYLQYDGQTNIISKGKFDRNKFAELASLRDIYNPTSFSNNIIFNSVRHNYLFDENSQERFVYNSLGQLSKTNSGDGATKFFLYDAVGNAVQEVSSFVKDISAYSIDQVRAELYDPDTRYDYTVKSSFYDAKNQLLLLKEQAQNLVAGETIANPSETSGTVGYSYDWGRVSSSTKKKFVATEHWTQLKRWNGDWRGRNYLWRAEISTEDMSEFTGLFNNVVLTQNGNLLAAPSRSGGNFVTKNNHIHEFQLGLTTGPIYAGKSSDIYTLIPYDTTDHIGGENNAGYRRWGTTVQYFEMPSFIHFTNQPKSEASAFKLYYRPVANDYEVPATEVNNIASGTDGFVLASSHSGLGTQTGYYLWNWKADAGALLSDTQSIEYYYEVTDGADNVSVGRGLVHADLQTTHIPLVYQQKTVKVIDNLKSSQEMLNKGGMAIHQIQEFNAFGEVISEIKDSTDDDARYVTEFKYNKLGKNIEKIEPEVDTTKVNGLIERLKPTTRYNYDRLGRLVEVIDANNTQKPIYQKDSARQTYNGKYLEKILSPEYGNKSYKYDAMGNRSEMSDYIGYRRSFSGKYNQSYRTFKYQYDTQGRAIAVYHPVGFDKNGIEGKPIIERYKYDKSGNQIQHNNVFGISSYYKYDAENKVSRYTDYEGGVVEYETQFDSSLRNTKISTSREALGGYKFTTKRYYDTTGNDETLWKSHNLLDEVDYFGRLRYHEDMGNRRFRYYYDTAGRLKYQLGDTNSAAMDTMHGVRYRQTDASQLVDLNSAAFNILNDADFDAIVNSHADAQPASISLDHFLKYDYYNNNLVWKITDYNKGHADEPRRIGFTNYQYDDFGQVIHEEFGEQFANDLTVWESLQSSVVSYDELGRLKRIEDEARFAIDYEYDAVGNRRRVHAIYEDGYQDQVNNTRDQDLWYLYDDRNRFTTTLGSLIDANGEVVTQTALQAERDKQASDPTIIQSFKIDKGEGYDVRYNRISERESIQYKSTSGDTLTETYHYDERGHLEWVLLNQGAGDAPAAYRNNDKGGRVIIYKEYRETAPDGDMAQWHNTTFGDKVYVNTRVSAYEYNNNNQQTKDTDFTFSLNYDVVEKHDEDGGTVTNRANENAHIVTTTSISFDDAGNVINSASQRTAGPIPQDTQHTNYAYTLWDDYKKSELQINASSDLVEENHLWAPGYSRFSYNSSGQIDTVLDEGKRRELEYLTNHAGQIVRRTELNMDQTYDKKIYQYRYYYTQGKMVGEINDFHHKKTDYAAILADLDGNGKVNGSDNTLTAGRKGDLKLELEPIAGRVSPLSSADFDQNYRGISPSFPAIAPSTYTLTGTEGTWEKVASIIWGDESLWYLLAEANVNISLDQLKISNTTITVPNIVTNIHNNDNTFRPYSASDTMGNTSPSLPDAPPPPGPDKCKQAVIIIIVIIVVIMTYGAALAAVGPMLAGALAGGLGALAGQVVGNLINARGYDGIDFGAVVEGAVIGGLAGWAADWASWAAGSTGTVAQAASAVANVLAREAMRYAIHRNDEDYKGFDWGALVAAVVVPFALPNLPSNINADSFSIAGFAGDTISSLARSVITEGVREHTWDDYKPDWTMVAVDSLASAAGNAMADSARREREAVKAQMAIQSDTPHYIDEAGNVITNYVMKRPSELRAQRAKTQAQAERAGVPSPAGGEDLSDRVVGQQPSESDFVVGGFQKMSNAKSTSANRNRSSLVTFATEGRLEALRNEAKLTTSSAQKETARIKVEQIEAIASERGITPSEVRVLELNIDAMAINGESVALNDIFDLYEYSVGGFATHSGKNRLESQFGARSYTDKTNYVLDITDERSAAELYSRYLLVKDDNARMWAGVLEGARNLGGTIEFMGTIVGGPNYQSAVVDVLSNDELVPNQIIDTAASDYKAAMFLTGIDIATLFGGTVVNGATRALGAIASKAKPYALATAMKFNSGRVLDDFVMSKALARELDGINMRSVVSAGSELGPGKLLGSIKTTSGHTISPTLDKTTTILGNYVKDMDNIINKQLNYPKTTDFGAKPGGYNVLNVPDDMAKTSNNFWNEFNKPFLDEAIKRGDEFALATKPTANVLVNDKGWTGFGNEINYLVKHGYHYDRLTGKMVK